MPPGRYWCSATACPRATGFRPAAAGRAWCNAGAKVLLVGMRIPPNYGQVYTRRFEALFAEVARQQNASLVPFMLQGFADKREWFQSDGIHPTAEAQPRILDNIYRRLRALLTTQ